MEEHEVVPDVIDAPPAEVLEVTYDGGVKVDMGNVLTPIQVKDIPEVKWAADEGTFYTLCFTDPDARSRQSPIFREVQHWLVTNIPEGDLSKGETVTEYKGSAPPQGSGLHRYVFLVYKQPGRLEFDEPRITNKSGGQQRTHFSIRKFAQKYNLELVAGNFYQAEYDSYCEILHKNIAR